MDPSRTFPLDTKNNEVIQENFQKPMRIKGFLPRSAGKRASKKHNNGFTRLGKAKGIKLEQRWDGKVSGSRTLPLHNMKMMKEIQLVKERTATYTNQQLIDGAYCVLRRIPNNNIDHGPIFIDRPSSPHYNPIEYQQEQSNDDMKQINNIDDFSDDDDEASSSCYEPETITIDPRVEEDKRFRKEIIVVGRGPTILGSATAPEETSRIIDDIYVSPSHFTIREIGDKFRIRDCNSLNGTFIQKDQDNIARSLHPSMVICIGGLHICVEELKQSTSSVYKHNNNNNTDDDDIDMYTESDVGPCTDDEMEHNAKLTLSFCIKNKNNDNIITNTIEEMKNNIKWTFISYDNNTNIITIEFHPNIITIGNDVECDIRLNPDIHLLSSQYYKVQIFYCCNRFLIRNIKNTNSNNNITSYQFWTSINSHTYQTLNTNDIIRVGRTYWKIYIRFRKDNKEDKHLRQIEEDRLFDMSYNIDDNDDDNNDDDNNDDDNNNNDDDNDNSNSNSNYKNIKNYFYSANHSIDPNFRHKIEMQDRCVVISDCYNTIGIDMTNHNKKLRAFFGIFDGHQGRIVADFAASIFYQCYVEQLYPLVTDDSIYKEKMNSRIINNQQRDNNNQQQQQHRSRMRSASMSTVDIEQFKNFNLKDDDTDDDDDDDAIIIEHDESTTDDVLNNQQQHNDNNQQHNDNNQQHNDNNNNDDNIDFNKVLLSCFYDCNKQVVGLGDASMYSGSTATVAVLAEEYNNIILYGVNVGDSRVILCHKDNKSTQLSVDHTTTYINEKERVNNSYNYRQKKNNCIIDDKLGHCLRITRAIGDRALLEFGLSDIPYNFHHKIDSDYDTFLVFASDGIWDVVSNDKASEYCNNNSHLSCEDLAKSLMELAASDRYCMDNLSCIVVKINHINNNSNNSD